MNKAQQQTRDRDSKAEINECGADESNNLSRRQILKIAAAAPLANFDVLAGQQKTITADQKTRSADERLVKTSPAPLFFTSSELAMVDELAEMIIPADDHSPGARAAGVAIYLDGRLHELRPQNPDHAREQQTWRTGLQMVDKISQEMHNQTFMRATSDQRDAVLRRMAEQEPRPRRATTESSTSPTQQKPKSPDDNYREQSGKKAPLQEAAAPHKGEADFFVFLKGRVARAYYSSEIGLLQELHYPGNRYLQEFVGYDVDGKYTPSPAPRAQQRDNAK